MSERGNINVLEEDRPSSEGLPSHQYIACSTTLTIEAQVVDRVPSGSFHLYALSNEIAQARNVPEPGALVLLGLGLAGTLSRRRARFRPERGVHHVTDQGIPIP